jgi:hypothetical protein
MNVSLTSSRSSRARNDADARALDSIDWLAKQRESVNEDVIESVESSGH